MKFARLILLLPTVLLAVTTHMAYAVTIDWVTVGNTGNANDISGNGAVNYEYQIGQYEVTIQQYADFLNAVAATDSYSLYNPSMASERNTAGISRNGISGGYTYSVIGPSGITPAGASSPGNRPITFVSWFDAARFANWMQNGQGSGSTETGAYTLVGGQTSGAAPARNPGAQFYVPTANEWYKAAYYSPLLNSGSGGYWAYATQSNIAPGNAIGSGANQANFVWSASGIGLFCVTKTPAISLGQNGLTDVGAFTNSQSYYGTFDQSGNVNEWTDLTGASSSVRGVQGGAWTSNASDWAAFAGGTFGPSLENLVIGFRLASPVPVPEPSTYAMTLAGIACGGFSMWRRRKRT